MFPGGIHFLPNFFSKVKKKLKKVLVFLKYLQKIL